jgi:hypothetical protein
MTRRRIVEVALRAYPRRLRAARGPEMADTLLESSEHSRTRFAREIVVLTRRGLGERAGAGGGGEGTARLFADGAALAGTLYTAAYLASWLAVDARHAGTGTAQLVVLGAVFALTLAGRDRLAGVGLLAFVAWRLVEEPDRLLTALWWAPLLPPLLCGLSMVAVPRRRPRPHFELLCTVVPLAALIAGLSAVPYALVAVAAVSVLAAAVDVRPLIACAITLLSAGLTLALLHQSTDASATLLVLGPALLGASALRARRLAAAGR